MIYLPFDLWLRLVHHVDMDTLTEALSLITTPSELARVLGKHKSTGSRIMSGDLKPGLEDMKVMLKHYSKLNYKMFL